MNSDLITLTARQFLERWKLLAHYEPLPAGVEIEYSTGLDLDTLLMMQADAWYASRFSEAPREILPVSEIAPSLTPVRLPDGAARIALPDGIIDLVSVMVDGWYHPASIIRDPDSAVARAQCNPFCRAGSHHPVALYSRSGRSLTLFTPPPGNISLTSVRAILRPEKGVYLFTPELLATIPSLTP